MPDRKETEKELVDKTKVCIKCGKEKPLAGFSKGKAGKKINTCKSCYKIYFREYAKKPEYQKKRKIYSTKYFEKNKTRLVTQRKNYRNSLKGMNTYYKKRFGITKSEYDILYEVQNGRCAVCGKTNGDKRKLAVDHNHKTGKVRGLLCNKCNMMLGVSQESIELLANMMGYLREWQ